MYLVLAASIGSCQSWRLIHPLDTSFFHIDSIAEIPNSVVEGEVLSLRLDSVSNDSYGLCYYPEPIIWRNKWMWIDTSDCLIPSAWIGDKVCESDNLWTFQVNNGVLKFCPFLDTQLIYHDPLKDSITAELTSSDWVKIAKSSLYDSVKVFRIQHFQLNDSGTFGIWHEYEIIISKNFGIVHFPVLHFFPELFASVELLAHRNVNNKYQYWHYPGRFFLDINDELAFKGHYQSSGAGYYVEYEFTEFWTVSEREIANNGQDLIISFDVGSQKLGYSVQTYEQQITYIDKIESRVKTRTFENVQGSLFLPRIMTLYTDSDSIYSVGSILKLQPCWGYTEIGESRPGLILDSNCYVTEGFIEFDPTSSVSGILGIGESYYYRNEALLQQVRESSYLVYIKSDSITCGSRPWPLSVSEEGKEPLKIYVSEDGSFLSVYYPQTKYLLSLISSTGQTQLELAVQERNTEINISNLASGIYILAIKAESGVETAKFVKH